MIGQTVSHYEILEKLGSGAFGEVYKATDLKLKRTVALKFLRPDLAEDEHFKMRFTREAQSASATDHPNIATVHEIDATEDGQLFMVQAYYSGNTLQQRIEEGSINLDQAIDIAVQLARGLACAHENDIIHRDLKPANILVTDEGVVKIIDFGLARVTDATAMTAMGQAVGTLAYMSPEQLNGDAATMASDVWAVGSIFYEMLAGRRPFDGETPGAAINAIINVAPEPLADIAQDSPDWLVALVNRALSKDVGLRYPSAVELKNELEEFAPVPGHIMPRRSFGERFFRPAIAAPAILIVAVAAFGALTYGRRAAEVRWAREEGLPELQRMVDEGELFNAFVFSQRVEAAISGDPILDHLKPRYARELTLQTNPADAEISFKSPIDRASPWVILGQTPLESAAVPQGLLRWRIEKPGFEPIELVPGTAFLHENVLQLEPAGTWPVGMVRTFPSDGPVRPNLSVLRSWNTVREVRLDSFFVDRFEVTNKEFKTFVDAGGYENRDLWSQRFVLDGEEVGWEAAMFRFRDQTGRTGPSIWEGGSFPEGEGDHPVGGVSWYEAAAYAEFVGKQLPTIYHWAYAGSMNSAIAGRLANFESSGAMGVGETQALSWAGLHDTAGNVREWCLNREDEGGSNHYVLGGAWNDPSYSFRAANSRPSFDRDPGNGFRLVSYPGEDPVTTAATDRIPRPTIPLASPIGDELFDIYKRNYDYDKGELAEAAEEVDDANPYWKKEKIIINAAYGGERFPVFVLLPKNVEPPYQTVVYFPGSGVRGRGQLDLAGVDSPVLDFLLKSGRAVIYPVYQATFERNERFREIDHRPDTTAFYRDLMVMQSNDLGRTIDYLETRPQDFDLDRLAFVGNSWGARLGGIFPAIEARIKVQVLHAAGLFVLESPPEAEPAYFMPRVKIPTLMISGKFDFNWGIDTVNLFFDLLGTPVEDKELILYDTGHNVRANLDELREDTLAWLDRYFGPPG